MVLTLSDFRMLVNLLEMPNIFLKSRPSILRNLAPSRRQRRQTVTTAAKKPKTSASKLTIIAKLPQKRPNLPPPLKPRDYFSTTVLRLPPPRFRLTGHPRHSRLLSNPDPLLWILLPTMGATNPHLVPCRRTQFPNVKCSDGKGKRAARRRARYRLLPQRRRKSPPNTKTERLKRKHSATIFSSAKWILRTKEFTVLETGSAEPGLRTKTISNRRIPNHS